MLELVVAFVDRFCVVRPGPPLGVAVCCSPKLLAFVCERGDFDGLLDCCAAGGIWIFEEVAPDHPKVRLLRRVPFVLEGLKFERCHVLVVC